MTQRLKTATKAVTRVCLIMALAGPLLFLPRDVRASDKAAPSAATLTGIMISFKLDPRLTRGLYMGDRWVSPPTYTCVGEGQECSVPVRAGGIDSKGRTVKISPTWTPKDPGMATVTPGQGNQVLITVKRAGESSLKVTSHGLSKELSIKATRQGSAMRVEISQ